MIFFCSSLMRSGQIRILSRIMMPLLIVQFLLGMFANLFITFSTSTDPNPLAVVFTGGSPALMVHVLIAVVLLMLALQVLVTAAFINRRPVVGVASAGFASIALSFFTGIAFVYSGYENDSLSYLMAVGFLFGLIIYGSLTGRGEKPLQRRDRRKQKPELRTLSPASRTNTVTVDRRWNRHLRGIRPDQLQSRNDQHSTRINNSGSRTARVPFSLRDLEEQDLVAHDRATGQHCHCHLQHSPGIIYHRDRDIRKHRRRLSKWDCYRPRPLHWGSTQPSRQKSESIPAISCNDKLEKITYFSLSHLFQEFLANK